jgi:hypothetical protein
MTREEMQRAATETAARLAAPAMAALDRLQHAVDRVSDQLAVHASRIAALEHRQSASLSRLASVCPECGHRDGCDLTLH